MDKRRKRLRTRLFLGVAFGMTGLVLVAYAFHFGFFEGLERQSIDMRFSLRGAEKPPKNLAGKSLLPLLNNPEKSWDRPAYTQVRRGNTNNFFMGYSVRTDRWRYTEWDGGVRGAELYDHENDPREFTNLAPNAKYANTVKEMHKLLQRIQ